MIKKLIQICSILSLVVVFSIVSANAQTAVRRYAAQIPFDFNIGQKSYQAGNYVINISKISPGCVALSLEDNKKNNLQTLLVRTNGDVSKNEPKLVFDRYDNQRFLTKMVMPGMGLSIGVSKGRKQIVQDKGRPESEGQTAREKAQPESKSETASVMSHK